MRILLITIFIMFNLTSYSQGYIGQTKSGLEQYQTLTIHDSDNTTNKYFKFVTKEKHIVIVGLNEKDIVVESIIKFPNPDIIIESLNKCYKICGEQYWLSEIHNDFNVSMCFINIENDQLFKFEQIDKNE